MAYSIQYSPNGVKPMISNYVNVSHTWFDYIKNHTDINLLGFTLTSYSNYVSIGYYHSTKSYEIEFKMTASELIKEEWVDIGFYLPELLYNEGIPFIKNILNHSKYGDVLLFSNVAYWEKTENGDKLKTATFHNKPIKPNEMYLRTNDYLLSRISEGKKSYRQIKSASKKILNKHNTERAKYAYALKLIDGKVNAY